VKIAVYTIALNEEQFVERWFNSAQEADYLLIADTGSSDNTVELARSLGIDVVPVTVTPWRFDKARNLALSQLPDDIDYCIALDMDEVLQPGWRQALEAVKPGTTRPRYSYTWSWNEDGTPGLVYGGDKIHSRFNYTWKHPVHEVLVCNTTEVQDWVGLEIHHHPDSTKSRSSYLPLLKIAVEEDPDDDRNAFYYARELFFYGKKPEASAEFRRHLSLPTATWQPERAASMRYLAKIEPEQTESWLLRATAEASDRREAWVELATYYYDHQDWIACLWAAQRALAITVKPLEYLCEAFAWGATPHDLAGIAAWHLGNIDQAAAHANAAAAIEPDNPRLQANKNFYSTLEPASAGAK
jgi:glycosyltransferase involved in cell wall biosynthesis